MVAEKADNQEMNQIDYTRLMDVIRDTIISISKSVVQEEAATKSDIKKSVAALNEEIEQVSQKLTKLPGHAEIAAVQKSIQTGWKKVSKSLSERLELVEEAVAESAASADLKALKKTLEESLKGLNKIPDAKKIAGDIKKQIGVAAKEMQGTIDKLMEKSLTEGKVQTLITEALADSLKAVDDEREQSIKGLKEELTSKISELAKSAKAAKPDKSGDELAAIEKKLKDFATKAEVKTAAENMKKEVGSFATSSDVEAALKSLKKDVKDEAKDLLAKVKEEAGGDSQDSRVDELVETINDLKKSVEAVSGGPTPKEIKEKLQAAVKSIQAKAAEAMKNQGPDAETVKKMIDKALDGFEPRPAADTMFDEVRIETIVEEKMQSSGSVPTPSVGVEPQVDVEALKLQVKEDIQAVQDQIGKLEASLKYGESESQGGGLSEEQVQALIEKAVAALPAPAVPSGGAEGGTSGMNEEQVQALIEKAVSTLSAPSASSDPPGSAESGEKSEGPKESGVLAGNLSKSELNRIAGLVMGRIDHSQGGANLTINEVKSMLERDFREMRNFLILDEMPKIIKQELDKREKREQRQETPTESS